MYEQALNCHNRWSLLFTIIYCYDLTLENGSVDLSSLQLRITVPFNGQTTLLLSEKPVYNCYVIHLNLFKIFLFTLSTHISIKCYQYQLPWNPGIWGRVRMANPGSSTVRWSHVFYCACATFQLNKYGS